MRTHRLTKLSSVALLILSLAVLTLIPVSTGTANATLPSGDFVVRIYYQNIEDLSRPEIQHTGLVEYNNLQEHYVLAVVNADLVRELQNKGWRVEIDAEQTNRFLSIPDTFYNGYKTVEEIYADIYALAAAHPDLVQVVDYGDSWLKTQGRGGYDMLAVKISNTAIASPKPAFLFVVDIHAREIATPEIALRFIHHLVDNYASDADAHWLVDWHDTWVIPADNPDGHHIVENGSQGSPLYQRKNANDSNGGRCSVPPTSYNQYGTDQNRNHSFKWRYPNGGWSSDPCDQTYAGPSVASEPETQALENLTRSIFPDQRGPNDTDTAPITTTGVLITMHSNAGLNLYPWGWTTTPAPNAAQLRAVARKVSTYNGYAACAAPQCLYYVAGTTDDWSYGELGIASMTTEVSGSDFFVPLSYVDSTLWPQNKPALLYLDKIAKTPYMTVFGPDALNITVTPSTVRAGQLVTVTATIDDSHNGNNNIRAASFTMDTPQEAGGRAYPMRATDGQFNSPVEAVNRSINTRGLSVGQHVILVFGKDSTGKNGAVSATFLTITN